MPPRLYRRAERVPVPFVTSRRSIAAKPKAHILSPPLFLVAPAGFIYHVASSSRRFPLTLFRHVSRACRRVVCGGRRMSCCSARRFSSERAGAGLLVSWRMCVVYTPRVKLCSFFLRGGCVV
ncbi:unnamed protein product, partial [Ectocarpus sp. 6 AP-2014]